MKEWEGGCTASGGGEVRLMVAGVRVVGKDAFGLVSQAPIEANFPSLRVPQDSASFGHSGCGWRQNSQGHLNCKLGQRMVYSPESPIFFARKEQRHGKWGNRTKMG